MITLKEARVAHQIVELDSFDLTPNRMVVGERGCKSLAADTDRNLLIVNDCILVPMANVVYMRQESLASEAGQEKPTKPGRKAKNGKLNATT